MHLAHLVRTVLLVGLPWFISMAWLLRTLESVRCVGRVPNLLHLSLPEPFAGGDGPLLSVVVPACNEEAAVGATVRSLLGSTGVPLEVIAINDRSTDTTGAILDALLLEQSLVTSSGANRLQVLHIHELPPGWLGKPHALAQGVALSSAPYLLFTDADILFRKDTLLRALGFLQQQSLDHLILASTPITKTVGERMVTGALQAIGVWSLRLWKIADPKAKDSIGVGSFALVRRAAYEQVGGWEALRMEVLEDLRFGWEMKRRHHLRQQIAVGRDLLRLHWAEGAFGIANNLTKNGFALFRYQLAPALAAVFSLCLMLFVPVAALAGPPAARWAFLPFLVSLVLLYRRDIGQTGIRLWYVLLFPIGAALFVYALLRSILLTLARGGVVWRGTLYPLAMLRKAAGPLR